MEADGTELELAGDDCALPTPVNYRPELVMSGPEAAEQADRIREMVAAVLRKDVDYGKIPGTGNKMTLLKPGAEWLLKWFGLGHEFDQPEYDFDENMRKHGVTYRCRITKTLLDGKIVTVATCDGYGSRDEKQWTNAPWNTILKMTQKRALVGAALQATGSSGLFTQDMEDYARADTRIDLTPLIELLTDNQKAEARRLWMRSGYPALDQIGGFQAAQAAFYLGQISVEVRDVIDAPIEIEVMDDELSDQRTPETEDRG